MLATNITFRYGYRGSSTMLSKLVLNEKDIGVNDRYDTWGKWQGCLHQRMRVEGVMYLPSMSPGRRLMPAGGGELLQDRHGTEDIKTIHLQFASTAVVYFAQLEEVSLHSITTLE